MLFRSAPALDAVPHDLDAAPFEWRGLTALADPIRPGVPEAVASCHAAGVRVAMLTGDAPTTALAIVNIVVSLSRHPSPARRTRADHCRHAYFAV